MYKKHYVPAIKSLNKWLHDFPERNIETASFRYRRDRKELYCIDPEVGLVKVDLQSYCESDRLRQLFHEELAEQIDYQARAIPREAEEMSIEVAALSEQFQDLILRLNRHGCRLQIGRNGQIRIVPQPQADRETDQNIEAASNDEPASPGPQAVIDENQDQSTSESLNDDEEGDQDEI